MRGAVRASATTSSRHLERGGRGLAGGPLPQPPAAATNKAAPPPAHLRLHGRGLGLALVQPYLPGSHALVQHLQSLDIVSVDPYKGFSIHTSVAECPATLHLHVMHSHITSTPTCSLAVL